MKLLGYSDTLTAEPGDAITFMVSAETEKYSATMVRLICGDDHPDGPGFKEEIVGEVEARDFPGRYQAFRAGSYVLVPPSNQLNLASPFTVAAWIFPTTTSLGRPQGLVSRWNQASLHGYSLLLDEEGRIAFRVGDGSGKTGVVKSTRSLQDHAWYFVAGSFDVASATLTVRYHRRDTWGDPDDRATQTATPEITEIPTSLEPLAIGAEAVARWQSKSAQPAGPFNGKIDCPMLLAFAPNNEEFGHLAADPAGGDVQDRTIARWDFSVDMSSTSVHETSCLGLHGSLINMPMRACTGHLWAGSAASWRDAPEQFGAIHFHEDDLEDAQWEPDFQITVPANLRSGVYAMKLTAPGAEDYLPFVVRPPVSRPTAPALVLLPTFTYLAYANEHKAWLNPERAVTLGVPDISEFVQDQDRYMLEHRLLSLYEKHSDLSGVAYSSSQRPLLTVRPKYDKPLFRAPHNFNADLYLVDWLVEKGFPFDVATDDDLHRDGNALLQSYKVVLTGSHPEYWSADMMAGMTGYLAQGGRLMYLGGNGFYWVTSVHPDRPHVIEVRRGNAGTRAWSSEPGECYHSTTGELGGLWRDRGRAPQSVIGVGTGGIGCDRALPYHRLEPSFDEKFRFIFEGVDADAPIGQAGRLLGGAAGLEVDRLDYELGSPPHAVILATATGFSDHYLGCIEEAMESDQVHGGTANPKVRADMVYFDGPNGGAVFSVGSMAWISSLFCNSYENPVSRITENVLTAFVNRPA